MTQSKQKKRKKDQSRDHEVEKGLGKNETQSDFFRTLIKSINWSDESGITENTNCY